MPSHHISELLPAHRRQHRPLSPKREQRMQLIANAAGSPQTNQPRRESRSRSMMSEAISTRPRPPAPDTPSYQVRHTANRAQASEGANAFMKSLGRYQFLGKSRLGNCTDNSPMFHLDPEPALVQPQDDAFGQGSWSGKIIANRFCAAILK